MDVKPLKPLLRGNFNCDFLGEICEGEARKDEAVQWRSSGGGHWSLLGITLHQQKSTLLQQQRDTMYSAVVRVGFNRWLLLLPGFRIPELNWSLQHCASGAVEQFSGAHRKPLHNFSQVSTAAIYLPLLLKCNTL